MCLAAAQKIVAQKKQAALQACKSLPNSPSHSGGSTPGSAHFPGQVATPTVAQPRATNKWANAGAQSAVSVSTCSDGASVQLHLHVTPSLSHHFLCITSVPLYCISWSSYSNITSLLSHHFLFITSLPLNHITPSFPPGLPAPGSSSSSSPSSCQPSITFVSIIHPVCLYPTPPTPPPPHLFTAPPGE